MGLKSTVNQNSFKRMALCHLENISREKGQKERHDLTVDLITLLMYSSI